MFRFFLRLRFCSPGQMKQEGGRTGLPDPTHDQPWRRVLCRTCPKVGLGQ